MIRWSLRRWIQFRLRTLLVLVTLLALPMAWLGGEYRQREREKQIVAWVRANGGYATLRQPEHTRWWNRALDRWLGPVVVGVGFWEKSQVKDLSPLVELQDLRSLYLDHDAFDLSPLVALDRLEMLQLYGQAVTQLPKFGPLKQLRHVIIHSTQITDLTPLGTLSGLEWLDISKSPVVDISPLEQLSKLQVVSLVDTPVEDLAPLGKLPRLERLEISSVLIVSSEPNYTITVSDFAPLAGLTKLRTLVINNVPIRELESLSSLTQLEHLALMNLEGMGVEPGDFHHLKQLTRLKRLNLSHSSIDDLTPLGDLRELVVLDLGGVPARDLAPLETLTALRHVRIDDKIVDDPAITRLAEALPQCQVHCVSQRNPNRHEDVEVELFAFPYPD